MKHRKGQTDLVANLNRALAQIKMDGTYNKIAGQYFAFALANWAPPTTQ